MALRYPKKAKATFKTEVELALSVASWAEAHGWEVFKEVHTADGDIDLVLKQGEVLWAIETKLRLNCEVLEQAFRRLLHVHYVSVAVPKKKGDLPFVYKKFMDAYGIGLLEVKHPDDCRIKVTDLGDGRHTFKSGMDYEVNWRYAAYEEVEAKVWRPHDLSKRVKQGNARVKKIKALKAFLCEKHKTLIAGAPNGGQWTPWKSTVENVKTYLQKVGSATTATIIDNIEYHYRTKRAAKAGIYRLMNVIEKRNFKKEYVGKELVWSLKSA